MSSVPEIIDQIRNYVNTNHPSATGAGDGEELQTISVEEFNRLHDLAQWYASVCQDINERAYMCQEFLGQGQLQKAVELAKRGPDLRAITKAVDFRERALWLDICEEYELPFPDIIDTDVVNVVIDEAYGKKRTMQSLLGLHRRMAMGKAPLSDRLRVLRKLCKADSTNKIWKDDLEVIERARVEELIKAAERADRGGDLAALETIQRDLASNEWLNPPTKALLRGVADMIKPHRMNLAVERYRKLVADIRDAHSAMNAELCRSLLDQWYDVEQTTGFSPGAKLAEDVAPVEEWLEEINQAQSEEDAYDIACLTLEQAIDENHSRDDLEKLIANILRFDRGVPELLAARFSSRMEELSRVAKRKFTLRLTGVIVALLMLGAGVTIGILRYNRSKDLARWRDPISAAIKKEDVASANKLFKSLDSEAPHFSHDPDIESLRGRRDKIAKEKKDRQDEFDQCIARVEQAGEETPDTESLKRADALARDFREKSIVQDWREKIQEYRDTAAAQKREKIKKQMDRLDVMYAAAMASDSSDPVVVEAKIKECIDLADEIGKLPGIDSPQRKRLASIRTHSTQLARTVRDKANRQIAIKQRLSVVARAYTGPTRLAGVLEKFAEDYPNHFLAADFTRAAGMSAQWTASQQWREVVSKWSGGIRVTTPTQAAERKTQVDEYLKNHSNGPHADIAGKCNDYFKTAISALGDDGPKKLGDISRVFATAVLSELSMVQQKDGRRYYYESQKRPVEAKMNGVITSYIVDYIYDPDFSTRKISIKVREIAKRPGPAPQVMLAAGVQKLITKFRGSGWETFYVELADYILAGKDLDPILQAQLVKMLLKQAAGCDPCSSEEITKKTAILEGLYLDDIVWINPFDTEANQKRKAVQVAIERMKRKPLGDIVAKINTELKGLIADSASYEPAGVLMDKAQDISLGATVENGILYVLRTDSQQKTSFHRFGEVTKGQAKTDRAAKGLDPTGTLVFVKRSK